jgi:hypothetical protein
MTTKAKKDVKKPVAKKPTAKKPVINDVAKNLSDLKKGMVADIIKKCKLSIGTDKNKLNDKEQAVVNAVNGKFGCQNKEVRELIQALVNLFGNKSISEHIMRKELDNYTVGTLLFNKNNNNLIDAIEIITLVDNDGYIHTIYSDDEKSFDSTNLVQKEDMEDNYRMATINEIQTYLETISISMVLQVHELVVGK